jgi:hypothetical protein
MVPSAGIALITQMLSFIAGAGSQAAHLHTAFGETRSMTWGGNGRLG